MIYSDFEDNWKSVILLSELANMKFQETKPFPREKIMRSGNNIEFTCSNLKYYYEYTEESRLTRMTMVWSLIAIESLVNHVIADCLDNKVVAISVIENPNNIISSISLKCEDKKEDLSRLKSELVKKLMILNQQKVVDGEMMAVFKAAQEISDLRNAIVHNKPISIIDFQDGDVEVFEYTKYSDRKVEVSRLKYVDLKVFFEKCDLVLSFLRKLRSGIGEDLKEIAFNSLYNP